jgi:hypothetical protein
MTTQTCNPSTWESKEGGSLAWIQSENLSQKKEVKGKKKRMDERKEGRQRDREEGRKEERKEGRKVEREGGEGRKVKDEERKETKK